MKLLVINGPNLNLLGIREPQIYGKGTYEDLKGYISDYCSKCDIRVTIYQSNHEGCIVDTIQQAFGKYDAIVINPAAYTHTSIAIPDALKAVGIPAVEVHISDVMKREEFRRISYVSSACEKTISGKGFEGYGEAISFLKDNLDQAKP